jgi:signal transduction histidine kinase
MALVELHMATGVLTVSPEQSLEQVAQAMSEQRASAALVTRNSSIIGILTERDLLRACARGLVPWSTHVQECMTRSPVCISPGTDTSEASRLMLEGGFRHLPVTQGGRLVGIVSLRDLLQAAEEERMAAVQQEERRRLAMEIHDGLSQHLVAIGYRVAACGGLLDRDAGGARAELGVAMELAEEARREVRAAIRALRPPTLEELGLAPAVQALARRILRPGVEATVTAEIGAPLAPDVEAALYRIAQETLNNVAKHARAGHVEITIASRATEVCLRVLDDGQGFDPEAAHRRSQAGASYGLMGIAERVSALDGSVDIQSEGGKGTTVEVRIPSRLAATSAQGDRQ